ncbi:isoprenoid biosynthesis glyoxalase ElbB [Aestuariicella hydrocarbonica]|uniref:Glyoxalase n=1 Tax=Pseudomaricurvus hydrocarbonicus TaxID=1470433 RepID=A0A9E5T500_9GAMM|nr:isoprenoid biosynthesis glyoxalase ElbB [Aestuariicella hydrocarbonica]NHO68434.1 isoprenoid biosynthesis glyoxalase ElbB [Aestuariicella hydrocarbonica]
MSKKVAVILAGCGVYDGSEIYESVITLLALDQADAKVQCFAPDIPQMHVVNHLTGEVAEGESRQVLVEAARLARGDIQALQQARVEDFDAIIVPGGFGVAKNLCDFAVKGSDMSMNPQVLALLQSFKAAAKPVGLICIAPSMAAAIFGAGVECTIGQDADTAAAIEAMGGRHVPSEVDAIVVDNANKLVTTSAYMMAGRIREAAAGINKLVSKVLELA